MRASLYADARRAAGHEAFVRQLRLLLYGYPLLWLLGLGGFFWPLLGLMGGVSLVRNGVQRPSAWMPIGVFAALCLSAPIGVAAFGFQASRLISMLGNGMVWIALAALISAGSVASLRGILTRGILGIAIFQGFMTIAAMIVYPSPMPVPLFRAIWSQLPSGLAAFATGRIYYPDWLGESTFRSVGVMANPTWAGAFAALAIIVAIPLLAHRGKWRLIAVLAIALSAMNVYLSLSRSGWITLAGALIVMILVASRGARPQVRYYFLISITAIATLIAILLVGPRLGDIFDDINSERAGSATTRSAIYSRTLELINELPVPLIGYGIKPQESDLVASVATHSTYLGLLFRVGAIGAILCLVLFIAALSVAVRRGDYVAAGIAAYIIVWCVLEDFDAGHLLPLGIVLAFVAIRSGDTTSTRSCATQENSSVAEISGPQIRRTRRLEVRAKR
jgi:hypothetical protein